MSNKSNCRFTTSSILSRTGCMAGRSEEATRWQKLQPQTDGTVAVSPRVPWYKQHKAAGGKSFDEIKKRCNSLFEHSCLVIAQDLSRDDLLTFHDKQLILASCHNKTMICLIWDYLIQLSKDTAQLYCLFLGCGIRPNLRLQDKDVCYRAQCLSRDVDLPDTIRFLNSIPRTYDFKFMTLIQIDCQVVALEKLPNLQYLVALSVTCENTNDLLKQWHRSLSADSSRWRKLKLLRLPQLGNARLFHDTLKLIPSLVCLQAGIEPAVINQIPVLRSHVRLETWKSLSLFDALMASQIIAGTQVGQQVFFDFEISNFTLEPSVRYSPKVSRTASSYYTYTLQEPMGDLDKVDTSTEISKNTSRPFKKPRIKSLKIRSSPAQFFGFS